MRNLKKGLFKIDENINTLVYYIIIVDFEKSEKCIDFQ